MVTFAPSDPVIIGDSSVPAGNTLTTWGAPVGAPSLSPVPIGPVDPLQIWRTQPSVRKVVGFIARNHASVPWHAYVRMSDTDRQRVADSPAESKLKRPRRFQTGFRLWRDAVIDSCLYDLWCVAYIGDNLQRISPRLLSIVADQFGNIEKVGIKTGRGVLDITDLPLAIGTGWSPTSGVGVSPMVTLQQILEEQRNAVAWRNAQWKNGPKLSGVLKRPAGTGWKNDATRDRFLETWRTWRDTNAGGTPILEDGMEYEKLDTIKPSDAEDIQGRQLTDAEVASAFHVPPELVGARQGTFSNIAAFRQMLFGPVLGPGLEEFQQAVNAELVPALDTRPNVYVELDREAAMNGSFMEQAQVLSTAIGGPWLTRNEGRSKQNLSEIEGGDELITPLNVTQGGQASPQDAGSQNLDANAQKSIPRASFTVVKVASDSDREKLAGSIARVYAQQLESVNKGDVVDPDVFHEQWDGIMSDAIHSHLFGTAVTQAQETLKGLKAPGGVWSADVMRNYVQAMADATAGGINAGVVEAANAEEWPVDEDKPDEGGSKAGLLKALTATAAVAWAGSALANAAGFGSHDAAQAAGAARKTWIVNSSNPRPSHAAMRGQTVAADVPFSNGLMWPGDGGGTVDEVAGCTCGLEYGF